MTWIDFLQKNYGNPVRYSEERVPLNFKKDANFGDALWKCSLEMLLC
jgi:hypothetical protein